MVVNGKRMGEALYLLNSERVIILDGSGTGRYLYGDQAFSVDERGEGVFSFGLITINVDPNAKRYEFRTKDKENIDIAVLADGVIDGVGTIIYYQYDGPKNLQVVRFASSNNKKGVVFDGIHDELKLKIARYCFQILSAGTKLMQERVYRFEELKGLEKVVKTFGECLGTYSSGLVNKKCQ